MTNQLMVKTERLVSLFSLVILLAVAPVAVGQSVQGPQQPTGATPTYGPGSDNRPAVKETRPATQPAPAQPAADTRAGAPGATPTTKASLEGARRLSPGTFQLHVEKNDFGLPFLSLKANRARVTEIAASLERELKTSVL